MTNNKFYGSASDVGIVREENQDAVYVGCNKFKNIIGIVCDGLGGYKGGALASNIVCDLFAKSFEITDFNKLDSQHIEMWFAQTLRQAKISIERYIQKNNDHFKQTNGGASLEQMATTIVLSLIIKNQVYTFWVGDSRAYLLNKSKETWQITMDHNLYNYLNSIKASSITFKAHAKELLALTNIVSKELSAQDEYGISIHEPKPDEQYLLLCSDGFYNFVPPEQFYDLINNNYKSMDEAASNLLNIGMKNSSNDNLSVVIIDLSGVMHG